MTIPLEITEFRNTHGEMVILDGSDASGNWLESRGTLHRYYIGHDESVWVVFNEEGVAEEVYDDE